MAVVESRPFGAGRVAKDKAPAGIHGHALALGDGRRGGQRPGGQREND
jgi:hypothetical protein